MQKKSDRIPKMGMCSKSEITILEIPNRGMTVINESGLYSLILSSKLPSAKEFKHWVTAEVLPSIRKTGGYVNPSQSDLFLDTISHSRIRTLDFFLKLLLILSSNRTIQFSSRITLSHIRKTSFVILHQIFH